MTAAATGTLIFRLAKARSMNLLRAERLAWGTIFAAVVAFVVAFALLPAGVGIPRVAVALAVFAVVGPLAVRLSRMAPSGAVEPGDQTLQYVGFFIVAAGGQLGLATLGYEGLGPSLAAFAAAWLVASRAKRLNPRRWRGGAGA